MSTSQVSVEVLRQHLIDPEICIRCNTCEETCPSHAVSHDARNYVVDPAKCNFCNDCIAPCPTGAIDSWRQVDKAKPYTLADQLGWDSLPAENDVDAGGAEAMPTEVLRITSLATGPCFFLSLAKNQRSFMGRRPFGLHRPGEGRQGGYRPAARACHALTGNSRSAPAP